MKEKQISKDIASAENIIRHAYNQGYEQGLKDSKQETCEQIKWERDAAIKQLNELGYGLGEKIEPCEDAISRQSVIDALHSKFADGFNSDKWWNSMAVLYAINRAPSVQPQEPKTGHWIETAEEYYKAVNEYGGGVNANTPYFVDDIACSECLAMYSVIDNETERFNHCPSCGAKMESEDKA